MSDSVEVFLFVDSLGWALASSRHFMEDLLPERRPIEMQFGYSCSAIPTILSGKRPAEHGHLGLFRFAPESSPFRGLRFLESVLVPKSFWNRGRIRHWLSLGVKRLYGFTGYFQLYQMSFRKLGMMDYCEKSDIFAAGGLAPCENLCDVLERSGVPHHISNWRLGDVQCLADAEAALSSGARFLFVYTADLDAVQHDHVCEPEVVDAKLAWYEEKIRHLYQLASEHGSCHLTVISDHGMTPLGKTVNLKAALEASDLVFGKDYGACYDSTMLRVTYLSDRARTEIPRLLEPFAEVGRWVTEEEQRHHGIYREDHLFGDAIFLLNPGHQIVPSDMGRKPLKGMHGFAPEDRDSLAAIMSNRKIPEKVQKVSDFFGYMCDCLRGLKEVKMQEHSH